jgi:hypothetical protein
MCLGKVCSDKSMEAIVLAETDEVVKTIKISTVQCSQLFVDVDTYDTKLRQFYTIIATLNAIWEQIK